MRCFFILLLSSIANIAIAQTGTITGTIQNGQNKTITFYQPTQPWFYDYFKKSMVDAVLDQKGNFTTKFELDKPAVITATAYDDSLDKTIFEYTFFLSPGDDIQLSAILGDAGDKIKVTGKGANNNQFLSLAKDHDSVRSFYGDTLPYRFYNYAVAVNKKHKQQLQQYITRHKPSASFIAAWNYNLQYEVADMYYNFKNDNAFGIRKEYERQKLAWEQKEKEVLQQIKLSNDEALTAPTYSHLIKLYLLRTKESLWRMASSDRTGFLLQWYPEDTARGWDDYKKDPENQLRQRIIEKNFTGKTKEYLYAALLEGSVETKAIENLISIYTDFKKQYPDSKYRILFDAPMAEIAKKQDLQPTDKMIFIKNGTTLTNWEEVLQLVKGKTVLLDMWGTWCGPCRKEMNDNGEAIKLHFKNKGLDYLYIANYDMEKEAAWKKLISFFNLEGYHIRANETLSKDIMSKIKGTGYPTYAIIDKYGNVALSKAGYPMDREKLIAQLEEALLK